jgi:peptide methionine sulfoxide reductase MsrA
MRIGDHTETVQVDFDPTRITYAQLLNVVWESHTPTGRNTPGQYMHAVFFHNDRQRKTALASKQALEQKSGQTVTTRILPVRTFTMAEGYHQKYILKQHAGLVRELTAIYPDHRDLVASTVAARLNGYAGGYGTKDQLAREIEALGLSEHGKALVIKMAR